jgi:hypothetical protein
MLNIATVDTTDGAHNMSADNAAQSEMICDVLRDGCSYLDDLGRLLFTASGQFRVGNGAEANSSLAELVSGLGLLVQTIDTVSTAMGAGFDASLPGNQSLQILANSLNAVLREILHAQERKDLVLLADLLEYELAPYLEGWKGIFASLRAGLS